MRVEQQIDMAFHHNGPTVSVYAGLPAELTCRLLVGLEDLADRVTLLEHTQRTFLARLEFLGHISRMLGGGEDWTVNDPPEPGSPVTEVQACVPGTSGPASSIPLELAGTRQPA
jgi:hypothetical protein